MHEFKALVDTIKSNRYFFYFSIYKDYIYIIHT